MDGRYPGACGARFSLARKHAKSTLEHALTDTYLVCPWGTTPNHVARGCAVWYHGNVTLVSGSAPKAPSHLSAGGVLAAPLQSPKEVLL